MKTFKDNKTTNLGIKILDNGFRTIADGTDPKSSYSTLQEELFHADFETMINYLFARYAISEGVKEAFAQKIIDARFARFQSEFKSLQDKVNATEAVKTDAPDDDDQEAFSV